MLHQMEEIVVDSRALLRQLISVDDEIFTLTINSKGYELTNKEAKLLSRKISQIIMNDPLIRTYTIRITRREMPGFNIIEEEEFERLIGDSFTTLLQHFRANIYNISAPNSSSSRSNVDIKTKACMKKISEKLEIDCIEIRVPGMEGSGIEINTENAIEILNVFGNRESINFVVENFNQYLESNSIQNILIFRIEKVLKSSNLRVNNYELFTRRIINYVKTKIRSAHPIEKERKLLIRVLGYIEADKVPKEYLGELKDALEEIFINSNDDDLVYIDKRMLSFLLKSIPKPILHNQEKEALLNWGPLSIYPRITQSLHNINHQ